MVALDYQIVLVDRNGVDLHQVIGEAGDFHEIAKPALGCGILSVFAGLDRQSRGKELGCITRVVPEIKLVEIPACFHRLYSLRFAQLPIVAQTLLVWVYETRASMHLSRPLPLSFQPPNGNCMSPFM